MPSEIAVPRPNVKGWRELQRTLAALRRSAVNIFNNLTGDPQSYDVEWTASVTDPRVGTNNGTLSATYFRFFRCCVVNVYMQIGTVGAAPDWSIGSGIYSFSLPIAPLTDFTWVGTGFAIDASLGTHHILAPSINLSTSLVQIHRDASASYVGSTSPMTWAASDELAFQITYPVAAEPA